ncbi:D-alanyl-D-alanine carboxypeptidase [Arsenicitalea aurantiaca]|uniref:serine-type D-Ala-D-Ala carboxypeptidase n=1 Tax=Arsenicitalea aurantiaca TaxID=1783274 RepID=A0A433XFM5_9HYPH|nr:D-alanyl-D-alanine carboxypeptidase family protein [Arsenicitalea aurantiaca]RUT32872.1 D-alanyl-D-alanine carboxypeptidase [Arsenicitalea aurantiaca]
MLNRIRRIGAVLAVLGLASFGGTAGAQDFSTTAEFAALMDFESGTMLYQKNADERLEPASMAKLMTIAVVFDEIRRGRLTMDDEFFISEHAWRTGGAASGGSTMFAELNSRVRVEDLLRSVIIQSGNDASIALAEGIAGTEETFALVMNQTAQRIGLENSHFTNAAGLPDPDMYSTARDLADLGRYLIREYPEHYHMFSEQEFTWNNIRQQNRNSLVEMGIGVDGLKTGHTNAAGYGIVASTTAGGRRLIAVVHGLDSMRERAEEGRKLITWGTRGFELLPIYPEGAVVGHADVYGGAEPSVPLVGNGKIDLFIPRGAQNCPQASIVYRGPLRPPVAEGTQVAELHVMCNGVLVQQTPLFAGRDVGEGDLMRKATDALKHLAIGWL